MTEIESFGELIAVILFFMAILFLNKQRERVCPYCGGSDLKLLENETDGEEFFKCNGCHRNFSF